MLNPKMLSARETSHMVWEMVRGWMQTAAAGGSAGSTHCVKDWVQRTVEECKLPQRSLHRIQIRTVPSMSVALRSIVPKIPGKLGGQPGAPGRQEEKPPSLQVHP